MIIPEELYNKTLDRAILAEAKLNQLHGILCKNSTDDVVVCAKQLLEKAARLKATLDEAEKKIWEILHREIAKLSR